MDRAPLHSVRQNEQIHSSEELQGEHENRQKSELAIVFALDDGHAIDDDDHSEEHRQPAVLWRMNLFQVMGPPLQ